MLTDGENLPHDREGTEIVAAHECVRRHFVINYSDVLHSGKDNTEEK